jgi:benzoate/toluate 1,2-dioxygenase beta subunit
VTTGRADADPRAQVSVIFDNRSRIATRLNQLRTGKRYAQSPASNLRRLISNVEILGRTEGGDTEVGANFLLLQSRARGLQLWGGRTTYRVRRVEGALRLADKTVVLVNLDEPLPTLGWIPPRIAGAMTDLRGAPVSVRYERMLAIAHPNTAPRWPRNWRSI